ncbi:MAG: S-layer homology domain-containing protein [Clostridiaceae bacterium]|nr:S-layer homology domain-containing protein [Clostridiaceae bacterium]
MVWNDFFSHFSLNADGSRSYDGVQVKRNAVFADAKGHWAQNAIENTVAEGLFSGVTDTSFAPNASATRGMLMTVLARYAGTDTTGGATWYEKGMEWAVANGIVNGSNGKLNPQNNATRVEVAAILMRFCEMSR